MSGHKNSIKTLWNTFGKILNSKKIKHSKIGSLNTNGTIQTEPQTISDTFNNFFSEIGEKLAKTFPNENNSEYKNFLGNSANHSMYLFNTTLEEVLNTIKSLKNTKSTGYDDFSTKFIKLSATIIAPELVKIFNLAINKGIYPDNLKIAKVIPIFKKGDQTSVNNYRPISILSPINKIFEMIIYSRLLNYIDKSNLLYKYQFGFRKNTQQNMLLLN